MTVLGYRPRNAWLHRQLDTRWRRWLTWCVTGAVVVSVAIGAFIAPRQASVRMRYEIAALQRQVDALEREQQRLLLAREALASPNALARQLPDLGLAPVPTERVLYLDQSGGLNSVTRRATPTPASAKKKERR